MESDRAGCGRTVGPMTTSNNQQQVDLHATRFGVNGPGPTCAERKDKAIKVLTVTTLYPNAAQPSHGIFVENRIRHVVETGEVDLRVTALVPWFPFSNRIFGQYASFAVAPQ